MTGQDAKRSKKKTNASQFGIKSHQFVKKEARFPFLMSVALTMKTLAKQSIFRRVTDIPCVLRRLSLPSWKTTCMNTYRASNLAPCGCYYQWTKVAAARSWCSTFSTHQRGTQSKQVDCWHSSVVVQIPTATSTVCLGQWLLSCIEQQRLLQHWNYYLQSKNLLYLPSVFDTVWHQRQWSLWQSLIKTTRSPAVVSDKCRLCETTFAQPNHQMP